MQPEVQCPECGTWYVVKADLSGSFLKCSKCGRQFRVPYKFHHFRTEENDRTAAPIESVGTPPKPLGGEASKAAPMGAHRNCATIPLPELVSDVWLPLVLAVVGYSVAVYVLLPFALGGPSSKAGGFLFTVMALAYCIFVIPLVHKAFEAASRTLEFALPDAAWLQSTAICSLPLAGIALGLRLSQDHFSGAAAGLVAGVVLMIPAALAMHQTTPAKSVQAVAIAAIGLAASIAISLGVAIGLAYLVLPMWNVQLPWDVASPAPTASVVPETGAPLPAVAQSVAQEAKRRPATAPPSPNGNATIAMPASPKEKLAAPSGSTIVPLPQPDSGVPGVEATASAVAPGDVRDTPQALPATLVRARYGAGEAMMDVTKRVALLLRSNAMIWADAGFLQAGPVIQGVTRKLAVDVSVAGQTLTLSAYDGGALRVWVRANTARQRCVGIPVRPGVEVVSARYGADIRCVDATRSVSRLLSTDGFVVASPWGLGIRDPADGTVKILTITLATESEIIVVRVTGDDGQAAFTKPSEDTSARNSRDQRPSVVPLFASSAMRVPTRTFLAEMKPIWISTYTDQNWGFGTRGFNGNHRDRTPIRVAGVSSPNGLGMHPPPGGSSWVSYPLGRRFHRFDGRVAINDTSPGSHSWLTFVVAGDGTELWRSKPIRLSGRSEEFSVDVSNVDELDLVVICPGDHGDAHAVWVEPVVYTVDGAPLSVGTEGAGASSISTWNTKLDGKSSGNGEAVKVESQPTIAVARNVISAPQNLLRTVDIKRDVVWGVWQMDNGVLVSDAGQCSRLEFPFEPPAEYDYKVVLTRRSGNDCAYILCYAAGRQFIWAIGAGGNTVAGFPLTGGPNPSNKPFGLVNGRKYTCVVKVRRDSVRGFVDGRLLCELRTNYQNVSWPDYMKLHHDYTVGVGSYCSSIAFHSVEISPVRPDDPGAERH